MPSQGILLSHDADTLLISIASQCLASHYCYKIKRRMHPIIQSGKQSFHWKKHAKTELKLLWKWTCVHPRVLFRYKWKPNVQYIDGLVQEITPLLTHVFLALTHRYVNSEVTQSGMSWWQPLPGLLPGALIPSYVVNFLQLIWRTDPCRWNLQCWNFKGVSVISLH